jgi:uncharacterized protein (UPF0332 family)
MGEGRRAFLAQRAPRRDRNLTEREKLLVKAERYLKSAKLLFEDDDLDSAVSRLYYAAFYLAEALLDSKGASCKSHFWG